MIPGDSNTVIQQFDAGVNFIWFTPTDNHNMHNNSVSSGDAWLGGWVPTLLAHMAGKRALIIFWWDEGYNSVGGITPKPIFLAGPIVKSLVSATDHNDPSLTKTLETAWGGSIGKDDVGATPFTEFIA